MTEDENLKLSSANMFYHSLHTFASNQRKIDTSKGSTSRKKKFKFKIATIQNS